MSSPRFSLAGRIGARPGMIRASSLIRPSTPESPVVTVSPPSGTQLPPKSHTNLIPPPTIASSLDAIYKSQNPQFDYQVIYAVFDKPPTITTACYGFNGHYLSYNSFDNMCLGVAYIFRLDEYVKRFYTTIPDFDTPDLHPISNIINADPTIVSHIDLKPYTLTIKNPVSGPQPYIIVSSPEKATGLKQCLLKMVSDLLASLRSNQ